MHEYISIGDLVLINAKVIDSTTVKSSLNGLVGEVIKMVDVFINPKNIIVVKTQYGEFEFMRNELIKVPKEKIDAIMYVIEHLLETELYIEGASDPSTFIGGKEDFIRQIRNQLPFELTK